MVRAVLDTNVLVSALINPKGAPSKVVLLVLTGKVIPLLDERILYEYRIVLRREIFGFDPFQLDEYLAQIDNNGEFIAAAPLTFSIPDPTDLPFLEVALSGHGDALITGNKKDFGKPPKGLKILSPAEFLEFYRGPP